MARQSGVIQFTGKLGRLVGMKNGFTDITNKVNFIREKVEEIKNPQSDLQMDQRAKMLPAVLFRRQLESVISRAWEGTKYGGPSTRQFMKYALKEPWTNVPQLLKDSTLPIPGAYLISKGSLPPIGVEINGEGYVITSLSAPTFENPSIPVATLSQELLEENPTLREGDQLTFIRVAAPSADIPYVVYSVASVYINTADTTTILDTMGNQVILTQSDGNLAIDYAAVGLDITLAAAVVLSREGSTSNQRSTQRMAVNRTALAAYFASTLKTSVAESYRSAEASRSLDWPYDESTDDAAAAGGALISVTVSPTGSGSVTGAGRYSEGDSVTLVATAATGYEFVRWTENGSAVSTSASYTFLAQAARSLVAEFALEQDRP